MSSRSSSIWFQVAEQYAVGGKMAGLDLGECRALVMDYVWSQMKRHGEMSPPFVDDEQSNFVKSRRVSVRDVGIMDSDGSLVPTSEGFNLFIRRGLTNLRRRGVFAHELGHTFLFDIERTPPEMRLVRAKAPEWRNVEGPAYEIGRQILVPDALMKSEPRDPSIRNLLELRSEFQASNYILSRRIVQDLGMWDVCILIGKVPGHFAKGGKFRGKSFRRFNVSKNLSGIGPAFRQASASPGDIVELKLRVGGKLRSVEALQSKHGSMLCLIKNFF